MLESIKIYNEDGEESEFYILEQTQVAGNTYLLATESDSDDEEADAWIFKQVSTGEEEVFYETIGDENELLAVAKVFEAMLEDYDINI